MYAEEISEADSDLASNSFGAFGIDAPLVSGNSAGNELSDFDGIGSNEKKNVSQHGEPLNPREQPRSDELYDDSRAKKKTYLPNSKRRSEDVVLPIPHDGESSAAPSSSISSDFSMAASGPRSPRSVPASNSSLSSAAATAAPAFPTFLVFLLTLMNVNESFAQNVIWPFLPGMTDSFNVAPSESDVGTYVGILASAFYFAQLLSSFGWGLLSDRYGRRPTLIAGLFGSVVAMGVFGTAQNYPIAVLGRFFAGALNGNIGVSKTMLGEICARQHQGLGFSALAFGYGIGAIIAPMIGGFLSNPAEQFPDSQFFQSAFFTTFPYVLPCLVSMIIGLVGAGIGLFALPETTAFLQRKEREKRRKLELERQTNEVELMETKTTNKTTGNPGRNSKGYIRLSQIAAKHEDQNNEAAHSDLHVHAMDLDLDHNDHADDLHSSESSPSALSLPLRSHAHTHDQQVRMRDVIRDSHVLLCTGLYGVNALIFIFYDELFSLFTETPIEKRGMGFSSFETGICLSIVGGSLICFQIFIFPFLAKRFGQIRMFRYSTFALIPWLITFPLLANLAAANPPPGLLWFVICCFMLMRAALGSSTFTAVMMLISNSGPMAYMGAINGVGQSLASLARCFGPLLGGWLWSQSLSIHDWSDHQFLPYFLMTACAVALWLWSTKLVRWQHIHDKADRGELVDEQNDEGEEVDENDEDEEGQKADTHNKADVTTSRRPMLLSALH